MPTHFLLIGFRYAKGTIGMEEDRPAADTLVRSLWKLVGSHLAKITVGLGALLVFVWQIRGDFAEREYRLQALENKVACILEHGRVACREPSKRPYPISPITTAAPNKGKASDGTDRH